jgi:muconate cycloisomerase
MSTVIQHIETILVDLPTIRPHKLSMTTMACQTMVIVRMRHSDGIEGLGEGTTIGGLAYGPESPESIKRNIDTYLAPLLIGQPSHNVHQLRSRLHRHARGNMIAKSALETALLDAQGKRLGLSVAELLGGARQEHLPVLWTLASGDTAKDIDEAMLRLEQRRHCVSVHSTTFCHPAENRPTVTSHFPTRGYPHEKAPHTRTVAGSGQSAA